MRRASGGTLVLGIDISDSITFDPAREAQYTAPLSLRAAYELLVTMSPGDYLEVKPALAKSWAKTADGKGWRFNLTDAKFNSGNPVTADDVKWTFDRLINLKDQPSQYVTNVVGGERGRSEDARYHAGRSDAADPGDPVGAEFRRDGAQGGGGAGRHRGHRRQHRRQGDAMAEPAFRRRRAVHPGGLDPRRADPADPQRALFPRPGAFRACDRAPHGRQRDAASGDQARRHQRGVQPDPGTDRHAEGRQAGARGGAAQPGLRLHGADQRAGVQQGAGGEGSAPGDRLRDRL